MRTAKTQKTQAILLRNTLQEHSGQRSLARLFGYALLAMFFAASGASAQSVTATVAAGIQPSSVAVNAVTNKIYIVNSGSNNVTVIDGASNATSMVAVGTGPSAIAVNPITNKIYVANQVSGTVSVLDGAGDTVTATVTVGSGPIAATVNPVTNKIYVANNVSGNVTVIDGATDTVTASVVAAFPTGFAVNQVTNKIYVSDGGTNNVTVIDGATNTASTFSIGGGNFPSDIAVNPVTNKIYVSSIDLVTVVDGATNTIIAGVSVGDGPIHLAVNQVTNTIYQISAGSSTLLAIDGATNKAISGAPVGFSCVGLAVNPVTNQIYVANPSGNSFGDRVTVIDGVTGKVTILAVAQGPSALAVNPVTNKIYAANPSSDDVTVIDGAANTTAPVAVGGVVAAMAVNPVTNKIYIPGGGINGVTVIDGVTNAITTIMLGSDANELAVNPVTNKIYVSSASNNVTVIDGASDTVTATVAMGDPSGYLAVNPVTNKIYVATGNIGSVAVIDGASDSVTATVAAGGSGPFAVNPVTNKIYLSNVGTTHVTVIDGATDTASIIQLTDNSFADAIAVNPLTNKVYVSSVDYVTVINGATNSIIARILLGDGPMHLAVDQVGNKIYQISAGSSALGVIDGTTDKMFIEPPGIVSYGPSVGFNCVGLVVNPVTNKIYVANSQIAQSVTVIDGTSFTSTVVAFSSSAGAMAVNPITNTAYIAVGNGLTVLTEQQVQPIPLLTKITPLTGNQTASRTPSFSFQTTSTYAPFTPPPIAVYFQVDTWQGPWTRASGSNPAFIGQTGTLSLGMHVLFAYASNGLDAGFNGTPSALGGQVTIGQIAAYAFAVMQDSTSTTLTADVNPSVVGGTVTLTATVTAVAPSTGTPTETVTFLDGTTTLGTGTLNAGGVAILAASALAAGTHSITAAYGGDTNFSASTSAVLSQVVESTTTTTLSPLSAATYGTPVTFTATLAASTGTPTGTVTFLDGTTTLGTGTLNSSAVATFTTSTLAVGTHSITANYIGSANLAGSTSAAVKETITLASTTAALVSSAASASSGAAVTFTATIESSTSGTPTGTVAFLDGTTTLGTGALNSSAVATFTTSTLTVGTHSITAAYGGDSNFAASTSAVLTQVLLAPSFTISGSPSSATVSGGNPATYQIAATGKNSFSSAVTLSCTAGLPTGANCAFSPVSVTPGATPATSTLTISIMAHTTARFLPLSGGPRAPLLAGWPLIPAIAIGLLGLLAPKRRMLLGYAVALLLVACTLWQAGCGSTTSNMPSNTTRGTPTGTYAVTVTGTSGPENQTASVTLVVQ